MGHWSSCGYSHKDVRLSLYEKNAQSKAWDVLKSKHIFAAYAHHETSTIHNIQQASWQMNSWSTLTVEKFYRIKSIK